MNDPVPNSRISLSVLRNWVSLSGLLVAAGGLFSFLLLLALDAFARNANPYVGILAYLIAPSFVALGLAMVVLGLFLERRDILSRREGKLLTFDLSRPRDRRRLVVFGVIGGVFLLVSAIGSYRSYHFTESVAFCGQACHTVMEPEYVTYLNSPHARVACSECHIGPGAEWYVKAKISGLHQVYATAFNTFSRPIETPIRNLRPAQETCEQCHWPKKFAGNMDLIFYHYLADSTNTPYTVRLLMKVGGGDPARGPVGGIHWHMNVANKVEYIATDEKRQVIPWVRVIDPQGVVTEYRTPSFKDDPSKHTIRRMDCMDCHNRPTHIYQSPNEAVDLSLALGRLDPRMPEIKKEAVKALLLPASTREEGLRKIAAALHERYRDDPRLEKTIAEVQAISRENFFPEMKASWKIYPNNIGHKNWPGCFRCHDGEHATSDGKRSIKANDCNACHVILAQGVGKQLENLSAKGHAFQHPGGETGDMKCSECHNGAGP
ncbi:MAG: NapC/NirT family cytochrome c [Verrucomicrobiae bacterium]|nr:NapC/NirT family cytochrome c [Verrucomicrobiae bacterium]